MQYFCNVIRKNVFIETRGYGVNTINLFVSQKLTGYILYSKLYTTGKKDTWYLFHVRKVFCEDVYDEEERRIWSRRMSQTPRIENIVKDYNDESNQWVNIKEYLGTQKVERTETVSLCVCICVCMCVWGVVHIFVHIRKFQNRRSVLILELHSL